MLQDHFLPTQTIPQPGDPDLARLHSAGRQAAKSFKLAPPDRRACSRLKREFHKAERAVDALFRSTSLRAPDARWLLENHRLISTAVKEARTLPGSLVEDRTVLEETQTASEPLPVAVGRAYLRAALDLFSPEGFIAFIQGFQEVHAIEMGELWALKPALQFAVVEGIAAGETAAQSAVPALITSLRLVGETDWKDTFETLSIATAILSRDPSGHFAQMDFDSRELYRSVLSGLAKRSDFSEQQTAETAIRLASAAAASRTRHVGYWLLDNGLPGLKQAIGYRRTREQRVRDLVTSWPQSWYLIGIEVLTLFFAFLILEGRGTFTPTLVALALVILPVTQAAVDFMNNLTSYLLRPRILPRLDYSNGIPADRATMVVVPTLLLNAKQVRQLVTDLEIRYLANRDANLRFALLTDGPDSDSRVDKRDHLVGLCTDLINQLNARYSRGPAGEPSSPFYLFHRHRVYNPSEGRWMGWERKRGKLLDLNQYMRGGFDSFPVKIGDLSVLPSIRYVLTLDSDTQLPRDAAHRLVGTMAHPLHQAVVDPETKMVVAGYGILQPRISISIQSASSSRLASIYSGQTGFDIYTRAVSDVYQDLFSEGIFTGKGIYDVDALRTAIEDRFPENALLSHDLIEGAYARVGLVTDIELIDDYPSHFSAYSRRKHRWVRGDWQILRWILPRVPDRQGNIIANPISLINRWKIIDNLRRSLLEPATLALFLAGWFLLPTEPRYWTAVSIAMLLMPVYAGLLFDIVRMPSRLSLLGPWARDTGRTFINGHVVALLQITFLLHQAMLSLDAIARSVLRVFVIKKRLLEWETAAEAENAERRTATVDVYLAWSPLIAAAIALLLFFVRPGALPVAAPILGLWFCARFLSAWLNRAPRVGRGHLTEDEIRFLRATAVRTWRFFREFSGPAANWLVPDNVTESGAIATRLSPTNLGFLLNARVSAVHFGYLSLSEFVPETLATLEQIRKLGKYRGHFLNWYSTDSLRALQPRFVSTVDSGNLAGCLWTLRQAALAWVANPPSSECLVAGLADIDEQATQESQAGTEKYWTGELATRARGVDEWSRTGLTEQLKRDLRAIAEECDQLASEMDFGFLYNRRRKVLSIGCDADIGSPEPSVYDLLASESRMASFIAIAKGDIPQESWFHLGRRHTLFGGRRVLVSWTGTMFEYLMPALWMKHYRHTIMHESLDAIVAAQRAVGKRLRLPWGISESACRAETPGADYGYHAWGIPDLAMKSLADESAYAVISPYSSCLALSVDPKQAVENLRRMDSLGWFGKYGFYEAADCRDGEPEVIRSWMAHHQGMILLAIDNLLCGNKLQEYFHAAPEVQATELLLHERVPSAIPVEPAAPAPHAVIANESASAS